MAKKSHRKHKVTAIPAGPWNAGDVYFLYVSPGRVERWVVSNDGSEIKKDAPFVESDISDLDKYTQSEVDALITGIFIPAISDHYTDITDLISNQNDQEEDSIYFVDDASDDPTVDSGYAYYEYLGTVAGDITDYRKMAAEENSAIPPNIAFLDQVQQFLESFSFADGKSIAFGGNSGPAGTTFNEAGVEFWDEDAYWKLILGGISIYTGFGGSSKTISWGVANDNTITFGIDNGEVVVKAADKITIEGLNHSSGDPNQLYRGDGTVAGVTSIVDCEDSIYLDNILGTLSNMVTPNAETSYDLYAAVIGASHRVKINAPSQPTFTSDATQIPGSDFEAGVDMYMVVWYNGDVYEYWFEAIVIA